MLYDEIPYNELSIGQSKAIVMEILEKDDLKILQYIVFIVRLLSENEN